MQFRDSHQSSRGRDYFTNAIFAIVAGLCAIASLGERADGGNHFELWKDVSNLSLFQNALADAPSPTGDSAGDSAGDSVDSASSASSCGNSDCASSGVSGEE